MLKPNSSFCFVLYPCFPDLSFFVYVLPKRARDLSFFDLIFKSIQLELPHSFFFFFKGQNSK